MHVVATAGHVDHGKSTLVRALTGTDPDRLEEERRRGLTIELGYAWMTLPDADRANGPGGPDGQTDDQTDELAFVDVPGHRRFVGTMLAGLGPAPAVLFVVAADEGWRAQSTEHLAAVDALDLRHGLLVVTKTDRADPAAALTQAGARLAASSLGADGPVPAVAVSARTGAGLDDLRSALARLVARLPAPDRDGPARLWVDRSFTRPGAGTVVTGTLAQGTLRTGDALALTSLDAPVRVRALQALGRPHEQVGAPARVAVNLRGVDAGRIRRGDALLAPDAARGTAVVDVRLARTADDLPERVTVHVGTAGVPARLRPLGDLAARLTLDTALPLRTGDRAILRDPGAERSRDPARGIVGVTVSDPDPPPLRRRGAARARGAEVAEAPAIPTLLRELGRHGHLRVAEAARLGLVPAGGGGAPAGVRAVAGWYVAEPTWSGWLQALTTQLTAYEPAHPLDPRLPAPAARTALGLPDLALVAALAAELGLDHRDGRLSRPDAVTDLGPAEAGLRTIETRLDAEPFAAPEAADLQAAGLGPRQLAAAARLGRIVRLPGDVVLLPDAPARAMRVLAGLGPTFTTSEARRALATTRRVAVPLLEHLDGRGWTRRLDASRRQVVRAAPVAPGGE